MKRLSSSIVFITSVFISLVSAGCGIDRRTESSYGPATFLPDGQSIVFSYLDSKTGQEFLYEARTDASSKPRRVTKNTSGCERSPALSPDGKLLAFEYADSSDINKRHIYIANADGSNARLLTGGGYMDLSPIFAPDSKAVYFVRLEYHSEQPPGPYQHHSDIYAINIDGSHLRRITTFRFYGCSRSLIPLRKPALSPDGKMFVLDTERYEVKRVEGAADYRAQSGQFSDSWTAAMKFRQMINAHGGDSSLWLYHLADPGQLSSIRMPEKVSFLTNICCNPSFLPGRNSLVFTAASDYSGHYVYEIYKINLETGAVSRLTNLHEYLSDPQPSPSGNMIVFLSAGPKCSTNKSLWLLNLDSKVIKKLGYDLESP